MLREKASLYPCNQNSARRQKESATCHKQTSGPERAERGPFTGFPLSRE
jgi:hypothetical protein